MIADVMGLPTTECVRRARQRLVACYGTLLEVSFSERQNQQGVSEMARGNNGSRSHNKPADDFRWSAPYISAPIIWRRIPIKVDVDLSLDALLRKCGLKKETFRFQNTIYFYLLLARSLRPDDDSFVIEIARMLCGVLIYVHGPDPQRKTPALLTYEQLE